MAVETEAKTGYLLFHLLKPPGTNKVISSSDRFPLKPTKENQQMDVLLSQIEAPGASKLQSTSGPSATSADLH